MRISITFILNYYDAVAVYFMQKYKPIVAGVLTSESQWPAVMGNNYTGGSGYSLWYI